MLDITKDVCPMTFVKVKMGLAKISPSEKMNVLLKEDELKNVISSLKAEGHRIIRVGRLDVDYMLEIEKKGSGA